jgi:hypothetical protein
MPLLVRRELKLLSGFQGPLYPALAVEIPHATKRRLGLDDARSWVVLTEANRFAWPGPDVRCAQAGDLASVAYGELPGALLNVLLAQSPAFRRGVKPTLS